MAFSVRFHPPLRELAQHIPEAKETTDQHRLRGQMEIRFEGATAEYGKCQLIDYYIDLAAELSALRRGEDHLLRMSEYPVAEVKLVPSKKILLRLLDGSEREYVGPFSRRSVILELGRARRKLRTLLNAAGEIDDRSEMPAI